MIPKKICLLGAFSVGKTSLIQRYVNSMFDDKYLTTVGVKIEKKEVDLQGTQVKLMIWDLVGQDDYTDMKLSYLRGSSACIVVVDGTRPKTASVALNLIELARDTVGDIPFVVALNKHDLVDQWSFDEAGFRKQLDDAIPTINTSAKTGGAVEQLFATIAARTLNIPPKVA